MNYKHLILIVLVIGLVLSTALVIPTSGIEQKAVSAETAATPPKIAAKPSDERFDGVKIIKSEAEWKKLLTPEQFYILREKGTEHPFTGEYDKNKRKGTYHCAACGLALFDSSTKFDSGTGWPSFYRPIFDNNIEEETDRSLGDARTEVLCKRCGGHLGHVFDDGPEPTGLRYCINSLALKFKPSK